MFFNIYKDKDRAFQAVTPADKDKHRKRERVVRVKTTEQQHKTLNHCCFVLRCSL